MRANGADVAELPVVRQPEIADQAVARVHLRYSVDDNFIVAR
jgi:hypothetical protein